MRKQVDTKPQNKKTEVSTNDLASPVKTKPRASTVALLVPSIRMLTRLQAPERQIAHVRNCVNFLDLIFEPTCISMLY